MSTDWTPWLPFNPPVHLTPRVLAELVDGGQAFRWWRQPDGTYLGHWAHHLAALRLVEASDQIGEGLPPASPPSTSPASPCRGVASRRPPLAPPLHPPLPNTRLEWSAPIAQADQLATALPHYLGFTPAQTEAIDQLPWRSDPHLARCLNAFPGLRILHQPLGETLLAFLCSATKQIVQIKQMLALLAEHHGPKNLSHSPYLSRSLTDPILSSGPSASAPTTPPTLQPLCNLLSDKRPSPQPPAKPPTAPPTCNLLSYKPSGRPDSNRQPCLPTWAQLAEVPEDILRQCQLGFRAKYIAGTAKFLAAHPGWLRETETLPYPEAKSRLLTLPGVGEKIADCVLLFGCGQLAAFPVDTWMIKSMARRYNLTGWSPTQVAHFGRTHFGPAAGLAQQYLFAWEREHGKENP
jgi:N-glycosylase/DNA lyase